MKESSVRKVSDLMEDDHFRMGGQFYRILSLGTNEYGDAIVKFHNVEGSQSISTLILNKDTPFKAYNQ